MTAARTPGFLGRTSERDMLDRLLANVGGGQSAVLVIRGEAGIGKTALLQYAARRPSGFRVAPVTGVEAEMELPFAGIHQLCAPMLARLDALPQPQQDTLRVALGLASGRVPERLLVGLAVLGLLSAVAEERPLLCLVDDAHWLDAASALILGFVARRLLAEPVAIVVAVREPSARHDFDGLPELLLRGLAEEDARALLMSAVPGRLDDRVRDRVVAETRGNPLALLDLPRSLSPAELAGGFKLPAATDVARHLEAHYLQRAGDLPEAAQRLLLLAASEPMGDATLVWRAAHALGIERSALAPAEDAQLVEIGSRVAFRHPLLRSAIYRAADPGERRAAHSALAAATDAEIDPDRRAWHRAHAARAPDEGVADELERSASRAQRRGGLDAAAAFLERATALSGDPARRGARALDAAEARFEAGGAAAALELLATAGLSPLDRLQRARLERLRAQIALIGSRGRDAPQLLLDAARRLDPLDAGLARATYLDAFAASIYTGRAAGDRAIRHVAESARAARRGAGRPEATELLVEGLAIRFTDGHVAAVAPLQRALRALTRDWQPHGADLSWLWIVCQVAHEVWDDEALYAAADRALQMARDSGALAALPVLLDYRAGLDMHSGRFDDASALIAEADAVSEATGSTPFRYVLPALAAYRGDEPKAVALIDAGIRNATERGEGMGISIAEYCRAVLYNGLGRYEAALAAAERACEYDDLGLFHWSLAELIEASVRAGNREVAEDACRQLEERADGSVTTDWAVGMSARSRALLAGGADADGLYRESLERLSHSRIAIQFVRARLLYGEWLRRESRRIDAREQLRAAHEFFDGIGARGFAERARNELLATGETVRKRTAGTRDELTAQEKHIARLARDGLSNPEIGARLFLSPRTVEWHLHKVFGKLEIRSRHELSNALPSSEPGLAPA